MGTDDEGIMHTYSLFISVIEKRDQQVQVNVFWCRTFTVKSQFTDDHFHFLKQVLNLSEKWILPSIHTYSPFEIWTDGWTDIHWCWDPCNDKSLHFFYYRQARRIKCVDLLRPSTSLHFSLIMFRMLGK